MERIAKVLCVLFIVLLFTFSCKREISLRDQTAIDYITNHFNHEHYQDHLKLLSVEVFDDSVVYESVYDMELHALKIHAMVDIKENYVVSKLKYSNFIEINEQWGMEYNRLINSADCGDEADQIIENFSEYAYGKGVQTIELALRMAWLEVENRWMILGMYIK